MRKNIKVYWPDGHMAEELTFTLKILKNYLFMHLIPVSKNTPIKFGSVITHWLPAYLKALFTKPMPVGNGKFIQPTGKAFKMPMATVGIWEKWRYERRTSFLG